MADTNRAPLRVPTAGASAGTGEPNALTTQQPDYLHSLTASRIGQLREDWEQIYAVASGGYSLAQPGNCEEALFAVIMRFTEKIGVFNDLLDQVAELGRRAGSTWKAEGSSHD